MIDKTLATVKVGQNQLVQGYLVDSWFAYTKEEVPYLMAKVRVGESEYFIGELIQ